MKSTALAEKSKAAKSNWYERSALLVQGHFALSSLCSLLHSVHALRVIKSFINIWEIKTILVCYRTNEILQKNSASHWTSWWSMRYDSIRIGSEKIFDSIRFQLRIPWITINIISNKDWFIFCTKLTVAIRTVSVSLLSAQWPM